MPLAFAWLSAAAFAASLAYFLYLYLLPFGLSGSAGGAPADGGWVTPAAVNALLFSVFAVHHSVFARTGVKRVVDAAVSPGLERAFYTCVASILFVGVCWLWLPIPGTLYSIPNPWRWIGYGIQAAGVIVTQRGSLALDILDLAGVRQVQRVRSPAGPPAVRLMTSGVYGFVRHPLYFGWVLLVFGAPHMTMTRFVFAVVSSAYLAVAIPLEERSLVRTFGDGYLQYRQRVRWRMIPFLY